MDLELQGENLSLISEIRELIEKSRRDLASKANTALTFLYWQVGKRINEEVLKGERAEYGKQIVVSLIRQLSWTHFIALIPLKYRLQREFYAEMCRQEKWSELLQSKLSHAIESNKERLANRMKEN